MKERTPTVVGVVCVFYESLIFNLIYCPSIVQQCDGAISNGSAFVNTQNPVRVWFNCRFVQSKLIRLEHLLFN